MKNCSSPTLKEAEAYNSMPRITTVREGTRGGGVREVDVGIERPRVPTANPNYDPDKVAQAKKDLPYWEREKANTKEKLKYLPFWVK